MPYDRLTVLEAHSPLTRHHLELASGNASPASIAKDVLARANANASRNTYTWFDPDDLERQAAGIEHPQAQTDVLKSKTLLSVPISLKDCFDLAGTPTSCGSRFYAQRGLVAQDSAMAARLKTAGALITGKTHLHQLAYGITGENPDYGDCLQPRDPALLTGGSSSGAAASVQEGSALVAIGTDTGGSIRVPAALCGLVGYRASRQLTAAAGPWPDGWAGGAHLAASFDTIGFLLRDPRDAAPVANALFQIPIAPQNPHIRIGCVPEDFLWDCEAEALHVFHAWKQELAARLGAVVGEFDPSHWDQAVPLFAGIQASEAAELHKGHYEHFDPPIRDRLRWGASITPEAIRDLHQRRAKLEPFDRDLRGTHPRFDFLMLACAPMSRLVEGADHSATRAAILRYTAPFSLAGLPVLSLPGELIGSARGTGVQIAAAAGSDAKLLALAAAVGSSLAQA